ncbi:TetR family transcriptional regulator [Actinacidiphila acidipaludis]|uniref:TetR family transcriptional regulator n=1 Tax=Actinacidiphila acidipaludis TaxID=2873382 RepID=A0ABS7PYV3_9ACTN|nr:TetR family transcriptional regulator [Streptomyces acidipaludis]MBY8876043.1 TetR family transcriptional regulator [Streptomyces acidipaludis]
MDAEESEPGGGEAVADRRLLKALRTREALATAAVDLILERGLAATTVEAVAERADVTRRTFSRYFTGKEDAALGFVRDDGERINALLRARPAGEPPLLAYRRAVRAWLADRDTPARHLRPRMRRIIGLLNGEPTLFAAYERIRVDAQEESIRIIAGRLGTDDLRDLRPAVVVEAAAGVLTAALRAWARGPEPQDHDGDTGADLADLVERAYDALSREAASAAPHRTTEPPRTTDE